MNRENHTLYWIRYPHHKDPYTEGYIGVTSLKVNNRISQHKSSKNYDPSGTGQCLREGGVWEVLKENLSQAEVYAAERAYRPTSNIGMNKQKGGIIAMPKTKIKTKKEIVHSCDKEKEEHFNKHPDKDTPMTVYKDTIIEQRMYMLLREREKNDKEREDIEREIEKLNREKERKETISY